MFAVFPEVIHTLDPSITDEQIQKAVIDFKEGNILSEGYILGNRLVITYVPLLFRDDGSWLASSRIDISVSSEEIAKEIELDALQAFFVTINEDMTREDVDAIIEENGFAKYAFTHDSAYYIGFDDSAVRQRGRDREGEAIDIDFYTSGNTELIGKIKVAKFAYHGGVSSDGPEYREGEFTYNGTKYDNAEDAMQAFLKNQ